MSNYCFKFSSGIPLSTITFTVNSHADNHFYKYIYLFQILYSMKSFFKLKYMSRFFYIHIWFKRKTLLLFFLIGTMVYRKKQAKNSFFLKTR